MSKSKESRADHFSDLAWHKVHWEDMEKTLKTGESRAHSDLAWYILSGEDIEGTWKSGVTRDHHCLIIFGIKYVERMRKVSRNLVRAEEKKERGEALQWYILIKILTRGSKHINKWGSLPSKIDVSLICSIRLNILQFAISQRNEQRFEIQICLFVIALLNPVLLLACPEYQWLLAFKWDWLIQVGGEIALHSTYLSIYSNNLSVSLPGTALSELSSADIMRCCLAHKLNHCDEERRAADDNGFSLIHRDWVFRNSALPQSRNDKPWLYPLVLARLSAPFDQQYCHDTMIFLSCSFCHWIPFHMMHSITLPSPPHPFPCSLCFHHLPAYPLPRLKAEMNKIILFCMRYRTHH